MIRVDFHILNTDKAASYLYLARLVEKAYLLGNLIFILTSDLDESMEIDNTLWTYKQTSFLPHHILEEDDTFAPILISHALSPPRKEVIINLNPCLPSDHESYHRIIEIIYENEQVKVKGRQKYKQYQSFGYTLESFKS